MCLLFSATLYARNEDLIQVLQSSHGKQSDQLVRLLKESAYLGQGNPKITKHPVSKQECLNVTKGHDFSNETYEKICGAKFMAPLYNRKTSKMVDAKVCIDQFEFPQYSLRVSSGLG